MSVTSTMAKCGIYDAQMPHLATVNTAFTPRKCRTYENAPTLTLCERHHPAWQTVKATTTNRQAVRKTGKDWCHKTFGSFGEKHYLCTTKCACGGIGRRARLRIWCLATCRFESCQAHTPSFTYKAKRLFCVHVGISVQGRLLPVLCGSVASKNVQPTKAAGASMECQTRKNKTTKSFIATKKGASRIAIHPLCLIQFVC